MRTKGLLIGIICSFLLSCGDAHVASDTNLEDASQQKSQLNAKAIEAIDYMDFALSAEAEAIVVDWQKYQELAIQINYLKKGDLSFFNGDVDLLKAFITEFKDGIPLRFRTNPIVSRITIIQTALLKLNDDLTLNNISTEFKLKSIRQVLQSFSNLNYQLDKKLEQDTYDKITPE